MFNATVDYFGNLTTDMDCIIQFHKLPYYTSGDLIDTGVAYGVVKKAGESHGGSTTWVEGFSGWGQALIVAGVIAFIIIAGLFLIRPFFRYVAKTRLRELFTAASLLLVIGISMLMTKVGLSPALGTFLAGVLLANSEYRHELEGDIDL